MLVFVELKSVVTDSEVLILSNKIKKLMEVKTDTIREIKELMEVTIIRRTL